MRKVLFLLMIVCAAVFVYGCGRFSLEDYETPLPEGESALLKMSPQETGIDFAQAWPENRKDLLAAIDHSVAYLSHPSSKQCYPLREITHERAVASLTRLKEILNEVRSGPEFQQKIFNEFDAYLSRGCDGAGTVLFTGYYTPIFRASKVQTAEFKYPLYKLPSDLVKSPDGTTLGRKLTDGSIVPYYTREEIEKNAPLRGQELVWLADRFETYVVTIQGSAKLRLGDGSWFEIGYAGSNGLSYRSVLRDLVKERRIGADELSLNRVAAFLKNHPDELEKYLYRNKRYVFFIPQPGVPKGSLNVPVTAFRSFAVDKGIFPRACPAVVATRIPMMTEGGRGIVARSTVLLALDQDTGGALRAPGRCDIYMGIGDEAGELAGRQLCEGKLCYLILKNEVR